MPGAGPTWISGPCVVRDPAGRERLFAHYVKVRPPLDVYAHGLAEFDDRKQQFEQVATFPEQAPVYPNGHPFAYRAGGVDYFYFAVPYPLIRVPATAEHLRRLEDYEAFTCLKSSGGKDAPQPDRDAAGRLRWAWKKNARLLDHQIQRKLVESKQLKPEETRFQLRDADTGKPLLAHGGSVSWNAYRRRWVMIAVESFGSSFLGEVWYAEADRPLGPWAYARKVVTHDRYSFYNPKQHPLFDKAGGRVIFFEGTYTHTFSGNSDQTPRYDYNQIMYKLDLADPRLNLPVAVYAVGPHAFRARSEGPAPIAFFALDRAGVGTVPVYVDAMGTLEVTRNASKQAAVFHALPADAPKPPATAVPLYEYRHKDGRRVYRTEASWSGDGYQRADKPLCLVWRNPLPAEVPGE